MGKGAGQHARMCMQCKHGKAMRKRKLDAAIKYPCSICKLAKIEDAFPRAQLKQEDGKKCLACCKKADILQCAHCGRSKSIEYFNATMVTFPAGGVVCKACQDAMKDKVDKKERKNWFTCRSCGEMLPAGAGSQQALDQRRCLNCASRGIRQKDEQTCRSCKSKWHEQVKGKKRARYCLRCRRK